MEYKSVTMPATRNIALVAHDNMKPALLDWVEKHQEQIRKHKLYATGTTGGMIANRLGLNINTLISGPMGGDQQIGALIATGQIDTLIFFWDPLEAQPHDPDIKALLRLAAVWNIPVACNQASADLLVTSKLFDTAFERQAPDYDSYASGRPC
ncbi:methylglyoxal synthase [Sansalvadorimonas sp. 2012CJ34-2]|uniref:Methylglyoxal synthase n=1 Tax=Parendozoicomonas callyspongiae TaxID=2942213 RepID=A0ABT0PCH3_9GAMM|nr:methylglyoxal synthase [Sansalvadorimonas sp. 2012CJ34-2]MCL6269082.1 methylglyoxal synthase [Sansalvadorimonas sp. 2012CJ34-2]